jgi:hypothetical protein
MKLSLSVRVGEKYTNKREAAISLAKLADIAGAAGYHAICVRPSQIGIHFTARGSFIESPSAAPTGSPRLDGNW